MLNDKNGMLLLEECNNLKKFNKALVQDLEQQMVFVDELMEEIKTAGVITEETSLNYAFLNFYKKRCENIINVYFYRRFLMTDETNLDLLNDDERNRWIDLKNAQLDYFSKFPKISFERTNHPPEALYVQVICLKDSGIIYDEEEIVELIKGRIYFLKRKSIEHLLLESALKIFN